jgi:hypothetical protein
MVDNCAARLRKLHSAAPSSISQAGLKLYNARSAALCLQLVLASDLRHLSGTARVSPQRA